MQNCNICNGHLGDSIMRPYKSPEKVWIVMSPCCNQSICIDCLLKSTKINCLGCDAEIMNTLPLSVVRLSHIKIIPSQTIQ